MVNVCGIDENRNSFLDANCTGWANFAVRSLGSTHRRRVGSDGTFVCHSRSGWTKAASWTDAHHKVGAIE